MRKIAVCLLLIAVSGCNMWGYRGSPFESSVYEQTYFDLDSNMAHFPEAVVDRCSAMYRCNGQIVPGSVTRDTSQGLASRPDVFRFPKGIFDSCKGNEIVISFWEKKTGNARYEFIILRHHWNDTATRRISGQVHAKPGPIGSSF